MFRLPISQPQTCRSLQNTCSIFNHRSSKCLYACRSFLKMSTSRWSNQPEDLTAITKAIRWHLSACKAMTWRQMQTKALFGNANPSSSCSLDRCKELHPYPEAYCETDGAFDATGTTSSTTSSQHCFAQLLANAAWCFSHWNVRFVRLIQPGADKSWQELKPLCSNALQVLQGLQRHDH